jgi:thiol-disulfide isomerase/thioredoxin
MNDPSPPKKDRTWLYVGLAFVLAWGLILTFFLPRTAPEGLGTPRLEGTGKTLPADYGWTLQDLDGKPVTFGEFAHKPVVLNLWATWCGPCRMEMPGLVRLAEDPKLKGVAFVAVTTEPANETVRGVARDELRGWIVLRAEPDHMPEVFASDAIPATFVIAPDGKVVASEIGSARWDDPSVVDFLEKLAKQAPAPETKP